jgi:hypothetical protein
MDSSTALHRPGGFRDAQIKERDMSYEFQSTLFRSVSAMCDAIAGEWLTAGGMNKPADVDQIVAGRTAQELATECFEGWDFNDEWLAERDTERADIVAGFERFVANRPDLA